MIAPVRRSPVTRMHADLGACFASEAGWDLVADYGSESGERGLLREKVGLADVTPRAKIDARGAIEAALGAAADAVSARVAEDWALVLAEPGDEEFLVPKLESAAGREAMITDATHLFAGFALVGPLLAEVVARLTSWDPATLAPASAVGAPIADVHAVLVGRSLGTPTLEAYVSTDHARYVWETLLDAVHRVGGGPVGWRALRAEGWR